MDYGKYCYQQEKEREAKKHQTDRGEE